MYFRIYMQTLNVFFLLLFYFSCYLNLLLITIQPKRVKWAWDNASHFITFFLCFFFSQAKTKKEKFYFEMCVCNVFIHLLLSLLWCLCMNCVIWTNTFGNWFDHYLYAYCVPRTVYYVPIKCVLKSFFWSEFFIPRSLLDDSSEFIGFN